VQRYDPTIYIVPNGQYTFNYAAKTIALPTITPLQLEGIQLVTNLSTGKLIYQFNNSSLAGTVSGQVLTLTSSSAVGVSNNDNLQILYNPPIGGFFDRAAWLLESIVDYLRAPPWLNSQFASGPKLGVIIDTNSTLGTVTAVSTVTTVGNQTGIGGINAAEVPYALWWDVYNNGLRRNITTS